MTTPCAFGDPTRQGVCRAEAARVAHLLLACGPTGDLVNVSEEARQHYTDMCCEALAGAVQTLTGWPVVIVGADTIGWVHAGCQARDGRIVDVHGWHAPDDWLAAWAPFADAYGEHLDDYDGDDVAIRQLEDMTSHGDERALTG